MTGKATILLVEDNAITRKLITFVLEEDGYAVLVAPDGRKALQLAADNRPDLVLLDLVLPDVSGFDLVVQLRALPGCAKSIILAFTGFVSQAEDRRIAAAPFDGVLIKPIAPSRLLTVIAGYLGSGQSPGPAAPSQLNQPSSGLDAAQRAEIQASALGVLGTISDALSRAEDVEAAMVEALAQAIDAAGLSRGAILLHEAGGGLRCLSQIGFDNEAKVLPTIIGPELIIDVRTSGGPVVLTPSSAPRSHGQALLMRTGASSALVAPIAAGTEHVGVLLLTSATKLLTGEEWIGFVRAVAAQIGQAIALRRAFEKLREAERRSRNLFETVNLVVLGLDARGVVDYVNPYFLKVIGYRRSEVLGHEWFEFLPERQREETRQAFGELHQDKVRPHSESPIVTRSGEERMISWHNTTLRGREQSYLGTLSIGEDITDRVRAVATLRESEERFRMLAENLREVFFITEVGTGMCLYVSPAYEVIWGRPAATALEHPFAWAAGVHPEDRDTLAQPFSAPQTLDAAGTLQVFRILRPDGSLRWIRSRVFPVPDQEAVVRRIVGVAEDITELRDTERQLIQAQKMEAVGLLAGGIAHDFNNLLAAITMTTDLVADDLPADDPHREDLGQIQEAVRRAMSLTRQLLAFSKRQVLQPVVLDPNMVISNLARMLGRLIGEDIELVLELHENAGMIRADPGQIEQVLVNLAVNARDAMPSGGRLTFATGLRDEGRKVAIIVADTGIGMTEEVRSRVFEPFFTTKEVRGTGLGLATVHGIAAQSGGTVSVASEPGRGSVFTVLFPAVGGEREPAAAPGTEAPAGGNETILFVEDEPTVRQAGVAVLRRLGYTVIEARNGREALAMAEVYPQPLHLVISDVIMPVMDGPTLVEQLRLSKPAIASLLMSGYAGDVLLERGGLPANQPFLEKPFSAAALGGKVRAVLDAARR